MNTYNWGRYGGHPDIVARFEQDTAEHQLTVLHADGLYRHLRFRNPKQSMYWFDIITWPGALTINGDMGTYTFSRLEDMFEFFTGYVNAQYWGEKLRAFSGNHGYRDYSERIFREHVEQTVAEWCEELDADDAADLRRAVDRELVGDRAPDISYEANVQQALAEFEHSGHRFHDAWEWDLKDYSLHYLWCCHAILWGIQEWQHSALTDAGEKA